MPEILSRGFYRLYFPSFVCLVLALRALMPKQVRTSLLDSPPFRWQKQQWQRHGKNCWSRSTTIYPSSPSVANSFSRVLHLPQLHLRRSQKKAIDMKAWLGLDTLIEQQTLQSGRSIQLTQMTNGGHLWRSSQGASAIANIMHCSSMQCLERSAFHLMP